MVKVVKTVLDEDAHKWLCALVSLSKSERKETLSKFCLNCGISYRHLYPVIEGQSAISAEVLNKLKDRAIYLNIETAIQTKILANDIGIK